MPFQTDAHPAGPRRDREPTDALVCTSCGDVVSFDADGLDPLRDRLARSLGFELVEHRLRLFGRCAPCRLAADAARRHGWGHA